MPKLTRRKRDTTAPMPYMLDMSDVAGLYLWPLGQVMTCKAAGQGWTDCVVVLADQIRVGGKYNARRVRYDGRFCILHNKRRVYLAGELSWQAFDTVTHVYGIEGYEADKAHNKTLKGY